MDDFSFADRDDELIPLDDGDMGLSSDDGGGCNRDSPEARCRVVLALRATPRRSGQPVQVGLRVRPSELDSFAARREDRGHRPGELRSCRYCRRFFHEEDLAEHHAAEARALDRPGGPPAAIRRRQEEEVKP